MVTQDSPITNEKNEKHTFSLLYVPFRLFVSSDFSLLVTALVDKGSETSLVRRGLIPDKYFYKAERPINFVAANRTAVKGGQRELNCQMHLEGIDPDTGVAQSLQIPFVCRDADIGGGDVVLSYRWLAEHHIDVLPKRHGLMVLREEGPVWVNGTKNYTGVLL